ncbi:T9SS type A sorting domain-containing protein [Confluentibacter citreus]|uniref:T9SS type A sorting domain-containing protein n=1 Tax=Confluentibacter citreus TaxID=2007307 RepID=UPI000C28510C|nr:T9SS type A sorting domain-containing protein [Confluentibacter citreus]
MVYKTTVKSFFSFLITCLFFVGFGFGQIITFDFAGNDGDEISVSSNSNDANLFPSIITRGTGLNPDANIDRFNALNWEEVNINEAILYEKYMEFTITPNSGYRLDVNNITINFQRSVQGPNTIALRSSLDGYSATIDTEKVITVSGTTTQIVSFTVNQPAVTTAITYRIYGWGATHWLGTGGFEGTGNDIIVNGLVSVIPNCFGGTVTWNGSNWNGTPDLTTEVIIEDNYDTFTNGSFSACSLTISNNSTLNIADSNHVEVENDLLVDTGSTVTVQPYGSFIQNNDLGLVLNNGNITVVKKTAPLHAWYEYTYWSSPVFGETIGTALFESQYYRRFKFNALQFNDVYAETNNNNILVLGQDDIDDEGDDWQWVNNNTIMQPGVGYAATHSEANFVAPPMFPLPYQFDYTFEGTFNNGIYDVPVYRNDATTADKNWNLIGNPYPSAIEINAFLSQNMYDAILNPNGTLDGVIYFWSQNTAPSNSENGNEQLNFSTSDYAYYNGIDGTQGGDGLTPNGFIPSGQAFFVSYSDDASNFGTVKFNNSMRDISLSPDNSQFFKNSNSKTTPNNKLWINLTSNNGVFNQILIGYANEATDNYDGSYYDAHKIVPPKSHAALYSLIENSNKKFAIQGKAFNSLDANETIKLGFVTNINVATIYTLSIAQLQGNFLTNNTVYLKDNLLNKVHNLSDADYTFTSEIGEFNDRFVVMFDNQSLSTDELVADTNTLKIIDLDNDLVKFTITNDLRIKTVSVFDLLGRELYKFKGQNSEEIYLLSSLKNSIYIAKVELSNGAVITKKAVKK